MSLAKTGQIGNICQANAILTLQEYLEDYGDDQIRMLGEQVIEREIKSIPNEKIREKTREYLSKISAGGRDFRF